MLGVEEPGSDKNRKRRKISPDNTGPQLLSRHDPPNLIAEDSTAVLSAFFGSSEHCHSGSSIRLREWEISILWHMKDLDGRLVVTK